METKRPVKLGVKKLREDAIIPTRGSAQASGLDLYAVEDTLVAVGQTKLIKTGIAFDIPEGYEIQVRPRSGLSLKTGLRVANAPGTVDADYTGECCVIMTNTDQESTLGIICLGNMIKRGDRIAQAVLCPVIICEVEEVEELKATARGEGAFGSTGK